MSGEQPQQNPVQGQRRQVRLITAVELHHQMPANS